MNGHTIVEPSEISNVFDMIDKQWFLITAGTIDDWNTMTASWGGMGILWHRQVVFVFVRPSRHTHGFMQRQAMFTCSFFEMPGYREALNYCGTHSGRDVDKAAGAGLTPLELGQGIVGFSEADIIIECRRIYGQGLDPALFIDPSIENEYKDHSYHTFFIGQIGSVHKKQAGP